MLCNRYMKNLRVLLPLLLCGLCAELHAQNFDESVEVTNDLMVDMSGSQRKTIPIEIPDSLNRFKYNFDYSVFATPYRGAYEFTPYNVLFKPSVKTEVLPFFYLRAGAGYVPGAVADMIVSPRLGEKYSLNIYQHFDGYFGKYRGFEKYSGHEFTEKFGVKGTAALDLVELNYDLFYQGLWTKDFALRGNPYHTFAGSVGVASLPEQGRFMDYNVTLSARLSQEHSIPGGLNENALSISGELKPIIRERVDFKMGFDTGYDLYSGALSSALYYMKVNPKVQFSLWKFNFNMGAAFSYFSSEGVSKLRVYPDVTASLNLLGNSLQFYLGCTGGDKLDTYYTFKQDNAHFSTLYAPDYGFRSFSRQTFNTFGGVKGLIGQHFGYDIKGGYSYKADMPLYGISSLDPNQAVLMLSGYHHAYVNSDFVWMSKHFDVKSGLHFNKTDVSAHSDAFDLPMFTSYLDFTYKLMDRFSAGFSLEYVSARKSRLWDDRAQYLDLGLHLKAALNKNFALWLEGSNLLVQKVEYVPMTGKIGPFITFGIVLNFR